MRHSWAGLLVLALAGCGTVPDKDSAAVEAAKRCRKAAEQGDAAAQWQLGACYTFGQGVPQDHAEAVRCFRQAAEQGHVKAQYCLAVAYDVGRGVPQDKPQAATWFRKAAEQGNPQAQHSLGQCYRLGEGVGKDPVRAYYWSSRSTSGEGEPLDPSYLPGYERASFFIKRLLKPDQIEQAEGWLRDKTPPSP